MAPAYLFGAAERLAMHESRERRPNADVGLFRLQLRGSRFSRTGFFSLSARANLETMSDSFTGPYFCQRKWLLKTQYSDKPPFKRTKATAACDYNEDGSQKEFASVQAYLAFEMALSKDQTKVRRANFTPESARRVPEEQQALYHAVATQNMELHNETQIALEQGFGAVLTRLQERDEEPKKRKGASAAERDVRFAATPNGPRVRNENGYFVTSPVGPDGGDERYAMITVMATNPDGSAVVRRDDEAKVFTVMSPEQTAGLQRNPVLLHRAVQEKKGKRRAGVVFVDAYVQGGGGEVTGADEELIRVQWADGKKSPPMKRSRFRFEPAGPAVARASESAGDPNAVALTHGEEEEQEEAVASVLAAGNKQKRFKKDSGSFEAHCDGEERVVRGSKRAAVPRQKRLAASTPAGGDRDAAWSESTGIEKKARLAGPKANSLLATPVGGNSASGLQSAFKEEIAADASAAPLAATAATAPTDPPPTIRVRVFAHLGDEGVPDEQTFHMKPTHNIRKLVKHWIRSFQKGLSAGEMENWTDPHVAVFHKENHIRIHDTSITTGELSQGLTELQLSFEPA